jgi:uncharacterized protein DUF5666
MGRVKLLGISLLAVLVLAWSVGARPAAAQTKSARGTVTAVSDSSLTVKVGQKDMTFAVSEKTIVQAPGAGRKTRTTGGVKVTDYVKTGGAVTVTYREANGTNQAVTIQPVSSPGSGGSAAGSGASAAAADSKVAAGAVKSVSDSSLSVTSGGKDMTFAITARTKVLGKGAGTATKNAGGKIAIGSLVSTGDTVSVSYTEAGGTMTASEVRVTIKAR